MRTLALLFAIVSLNPDEIPTSLRSFLPDDLATFLKQTEDSSRQRLSDGEFDHLIFYILQSKSFTKLPPIEPAESALHVSMEKQIRQPVLDRIHAFLSSKVTDERGIYFRRLNKSEKEIRDHYAETMLFLLRKEISSSKYQGEQRRRFIAGLYQTRGHSSDTSIDASYSVHLGLEVIRQRKPGFHPRKVLILGPGQDIAPRTAFQEETPPQSPQPFLILDSVIRLKLAEKPEVECLDINPRVVSYFNAKPTKLLLNWIPEDEEQKKYFEDVGKSIGTRQGKKLEFQARIPAQQMNFITQRNSGTVDLIVATNALLYANDGELALAMTNIRAMLNPGGIFLHNDTRPEVETYARLLEMPIFDARVIRLSAQRKLYDTVVVHERR